MLAEPVFDNFCKVEEVYHAVVVDIASDYGPIFGEDHHILRVYDAVPEGSRPNVIARVVSTPVDHQ